MWSKRWFVLRRSALPPSISEDEKISFQKSWVDSFLQLHCTWSWVSRLHGDMLAATVWRKSGDDDEHLYIVRPRVGLTWFSLHLPFFNVKAQLTNNVPSEATCHPQWHQTLHSHDPLWSWSHVRLCLCSVSWASVVYTQHVLTVPVWVMSLSFL